MKMTGFYAGTFDPPTLGHLDILNQAKRVFYDVKVVLAPNVAKPTRLLSVQKTRDIFAREGYTAHVLPPDEYLASWIDRMFGWPKACLIRGLRGPADLEVEMAIEGANRSIVHDLQTVFFTAADDTRTVSSSAVKALVGKKGYERVLLDFVTPEVRDAIVETIG